MDGAAKDGATRNGAARDSTVHDSAVDDSLATLSHARLEALLHELQKRAFELYEDAALRAETNPAQAGLAYERAEAEAAPLIARARALNEERARRLRRRAQAWRKAALAVAIAGLAALAWWAGMHA
ncbi:MAG TPA: hypothetical protein VM619_06800 [Luteimonas sp.]|nr:hypothetical protein [Luteimonas sp.]